LLDTVNVPNKKVNFNAELEEETLVQHLNRKMQFMHWVEKKYMVMEDLPWALR
jgi:hypothetical protein